jgi:hypothetical protein
MSQSASVTCCTLARVVVLFVLHVNIVLAVHCVNVVFTTANCLYSAFDIQLVNGNMESERRRCQVLHRQVRDLVYKVFSYFKREADAGMPVHDVAKAQDIF